MIEKLSDDRPTSATPSVHRTSGWRGRLVGLMLALGVTAVMLLLMEGAASGLLALRAARQAIRMLEESHARHDADLGWSHQPNLRVADLYGPGTTFTVNQQGFRATEDYSRAIPAGRRRIICLGDSFTMGFGVDDHATFPARISAREARIQTVNMGQGGYGLDQCYLWYMRDGRRLDADLLLLGLIAHDIFRMQSSSFIGYAKPTLADKNGTLVVNNTPVPPTWNTRTPLRRARAFVENLASARLARWFRGTLDATETFYGEVDPATLAAARLALAELRRSTTERGQRFAIVYLPTSDLLEREPTAEARWLEKVATELGIPFINLALDFGRLPPWEIAPLFRPDYHYTERGNDFVAGLLLGHLAKLHPDLFR